MCGPGVPFGVMPEVRVGTWGGFVFVNPDPEAESLESHLGELPAHSAAMCNHRFAHRSCPKSPDGTACRL
jgi:hypothetical protein